MLLHYLLCLHVNKEWFQYNMGQKGMDKRTDMNSIRRKSTICKRAILEFQKFDSQAQFPWNTVITCDYV
jgi:hypothetical protein